MWVHFIKFYSLITYTIKIRNTLVSLIIALTLTAPAVQSCSEEKVPLEENKGCVDSVEGEFKIRYCHSENSIGYAKDEVFIYDRESYVSEQENNLLRHYIDRGENLDGLVDLIRIYHPKGIIEERSRTLDYYKYQEEFDEADRILAEQRREFNG